MFITKADLSATLYPEITQMMTRYSDAIIDMNIANAQGEIETLLGARFNIQPELAKQGSARHSYLLSVCRDLAIYHLYSLQETIPAHRVKRYDQAIELLKRMADGKSALPGVGPLPVDTLPAPLAQIDYGSEVRRATVLAPIRYPI